MGRRLAGEAGRGGEQVLFEELKLPGGGKKGKAGGLSTDSEVLEGLAAKGHPIAQMVNDWRQVTPKAT